jgi:hypothetical protein
VSVVAAIAWVAILTASAPWKGSITRPNTPPGSPPPPTPPIGRMPLAVPSV